MVSAETKAMAVMIDVMTIAAREVMVVNAAMKEEADTVEVTGGKSMENAAMREEAMAAMTAAMTTTDLAAATQVEETEEMMMTAPVAATRAEVDVTTTAQAVVTLAEAVDEMMTDPAEDTEKETGVMMIGLVEAMVGEIGVTMTVPQEDMVARAEDMVEAITMNRDARKPSATMMAPAVEDTVETIAEMTDQAVAMVEVTTVLQKGAEATLDMEETRALTEASSPRVPLMAEDTAEAQMISLRRLSMRSRALAVLVTRICSAWLLVY